MKILVINRLQIFIQKKKKRHKISKIAHILTIFKELNKSLFKPYSITRIRILYHNELVSFTFRNIKIQTIRIFRHKYSI